MHKNWFSYCLDLANGIEELEIRDRASITDVLPVNKQLRVHLRVKSARLCPKPATERKILSTTLSTDLAKLLSSGDHSDIEIHCKDGQIVRCHKIILTSRSEVFKAMLKNNFKEGNTGIIKLDYMEFHVVQVFLCIILFDKNADSFYFICK